MSAIRRVFAALVLLTLPVGCVDRPEPHIYVLGSGEGGAIGEKTDHGRTIIELKPVLIPDHMDTTDFLLRTGRNELSPSPTALWGERLSIGITSALASALAERLPSARIVARPSATHPARKIFVDITALDLRRGGLCTLRAHWTISAPGELSERTAPAGAEVTVTAPADGLSDEAVVVALTNAISQIADRIAADL
jgi:uncharacterized lipoprotein YmbA